MSTALHRPTGAPEPVLGVVGCAADGVTDLLAGLVLPAQRRGWRVAVTLTPTAAGWLGAGGLADIESATGLPARHAPRLPGEPRPHPDADRHAVAPATASTVAKLALGIADNQALNQLCEAIGLGEAPVALYPAIHAAHAGHPAWPGHLRALRGAGVRIVEDPSRASLHPRGRAPEPPWQRILDEVGDPPA
jgi:hypothetical protein